MATLAWALDRGRRERGYVGLMDRWHAKENAEARNELKERWMKLQRLLARTRSRGGKLMPDWVTVRQRPFYGAKSI